MQALILDPRERQLPMNVRSCGNQPANISLINRREGASVSSHARVRKRRYNAGCVEIIRPANAEAHHISSFLTKETVSRSGISLKAAQQGDLARLRRMFFAFYQVSASFATNSRK